MTGRVRHIRGLSSANLDRPRSFASSARSGSALQIAASELPLSWRLTRDTRNLTEREDGAAAAPSLPSM
jgi:hypothetical protein